MIANALRAGHRRVRRGWAHVKYQVGALDRRLDAALGTRAVVLTYHRVLGEPERRRSWSHPGMVVSVDSFAQHVRALRRHFVVVSLAEFTAAVVESRPLPPRACLVTFDDGWLDTWQRAAPILADYQVPATLFVTSRLIGYTHGFWQERLCRALDTAAKADRTTRDEARARLTPFGIDRLLAAPDRNDILQATRALKEARRHDVLDLVEALEALVGMCPAAEEPDRFISWEQARELTASGFTIGAHGATHRLLDTLPDAEVTQEVEESKATIAARLDRCEPAFCYPNGSWSAAAVGAVEAAGFQIAFTTAEHFVQPGVARFLVPRVNMHEAMTNSVPMWLSRIAGVSAP